MSPAQTMLYFREWGRVRDVLKAKGLPHGDVERHKFHLKALGVRKSSKDFTNADLTKVLAAFLAITEPWNLAAQLKAQEHEQLQRAEVWKRIVEVCDELGIATHITHDESMRENARMKYIDGLLARIHPGKRRWDQLDDKEANVLLGIMRRRLAAVRARRLKHATPDPDRVPF